ncbi:MAG: alpha/beta hydrolase [Actinomycetota bacterium]
MSGSSFEHRFVPGTLPSTLLLLHGTGADENDLLPLGKALAPEANHLSPRGKVLENGMPRFFRRMAPGVFDVEDLIARAGELAAFVSEAVSAYELDASRVWAVGFSNGANIGAALLLLHPQLLRGAVLLRAQIPLEPEAAPRLDGKTVLVCAGRHDEMVPGAETDRLAKLLESAGAEVEVRWSEGGHGLMHDEVAVAREWLAGRLDQQG